ncbi:MAG: hypothetical protein ACMXX9_01295 [Candidatus Woesearchaeota archaeon]
MVKKSKSKKKTETKVNRAVKKASVASKIHKSNPKVNISYVSSEAPETFIMKEFLFGALFGLMLGMILMAMLIRSGIYF